ncbi:MAG: sugar kinase [Candidatus Omnitrophica bacterium]|nr:sugar kinase [Candidatus Omnitrophota bacterium]
MSLLIVGSIAIDSIQTPWGEAADLLGGSATYAGLAARLWTPVTLVGVVGTDFPPRYLRLFEKFRMNGPGLRQVEGKTFRWKGRYSPSLEATTLSLDLGVFSGFQPALAPAARGSRHAFLGNIHPEIQWRVLSQLVSPKLTACDSRADWIQTQRKGLLNLLKKVDLVFLNDGEAKLLTGVQNLIQATRILARLGPKVAVVKKGEHGVLAASRDSFFSLPGYPVARVVDPTGAGDAFAGACLGYLSKQRKVTWGGLCRGIQFASAAASITIEAFGPRRLIRSTLADVNRRARAFQILSRAIVA